MAYLIPSTLILTPAAVLTGSGTAQRVPKFTSAGVLGDGPIWTDANGRVATASFTPGSGTKHIWSGGHTYVTNPPTLSNGVNNDVNMGLGDHNGKHIQLLTLGLTGVASITGIAGVVSEGQVVKLINISAYVITIVHEGATSAAAARIKTCTGADVALAPYQSCELLYVAGSLNRWVMTDVSAAPTGSGTAQRVPKFTAAGALGDSDFYTDANGRFGLGFLTGAKFTMPGDVAWGMNFPGGISNGDNNNVSLALGALGYSVNAITGPSAGFAFTGIAGAVGGGHWVLLINISGQVMTLKHENASSTTGNRILCGTGADIALANNQSASLYYVPGAINRWVVTATTGT